MTSRSSRRIASCVIAGVASVASVATLALSQPVGAQEPRVVIVGGDRAATTLNTLVHISDDSLKALIETHLPDALFDDGDAHHVVLVLDADGRYVDGKVTKATVVTPTADGAGEIRTFVVGDTAMRAGSGPIVIRRRDGEAGVVVGGTSGSAITVFPSKVGDGDPANGIMGTSFGAGDVAMVGLKRFAAGQFTSMPLIVTIVRLK